MRINWGAVGELIKTDASFRMGVGRSLDVKRNQWVIVLVLAAFALMVWSGYANYKRRKQYAQRQAAQGTLMRENANNQSVQQDVAADEGLPNLRGKRAPEFSLRTVDGNKSFLYPTTKAKRY